MDKLLIVHSLVLLSSRLFVLVLACCTSPPPEFLLHLLKPPDLLETACCTSLVLDGAQIGHRTTNNRYGASGQIHLLSQTGLCKLKISTSSREHNFVCAFFSSELFG